MAQPHLPERRQQLPDLNSDAFDATALAAAMREVQGDGGEYQRVDTAALAKQFEGLSQLVPEAAKGTTDFWGFTPDRQAAYMLALNPAGRLERVSKVTPSPNGEGLQIIQDTALENGLPFVTTVEGHISRQRDSETGEEMLNIKLEDETRASLNNPNRRAMANSAQLGAIAADLPHLQTGGDPTALQQPGQPPALPPA